jgi:hypothetical protein
MAVFFKTPVSTGVVVRAGHLFVRFPVRRASLVQGWHRGRDGRLSAQWAMDGSADDSADGVTRAAKAGSG